MATKATPTEVKNLGFTDSMFSSIPGMTNFDTYIQGILDENVDEITAKIGASVYDDPANIKGVKKIEKYLAAAELWNIRAGIVAGMAVPDGPTGKEEKSTAEMYREKAQMVIDRLIGYGQDMAFGYVETSHFE